MNGPQTVVIKRNLNSKENQTHILTVKYTLKVIFIKVLYQLKKGNVCS